MSIRPDTLVHRTNHNENQQPYGRQVSAQRRTISKPLNFKQAMDDFQFMFPEIDRHVIETVLRANNGVVQSTIDQLLILQESALTEATEKEEDFDFPELPTYESSIGNGEEPPPAYSAVWEETDDVPTKRKEDLDILNRTPGIKKQSLLIANNYWKAPLVGQLSNDFLRIEPSAMPANNLKSQNGRGPPCSSPTNEFLTDEEISSINEDAKLAMFLQNEEFLKELKRNQEFVSSLEADHRRAVLTSGEETEAISIEPLPATTTTTTATTAESISTGGARPRTTPAIQDDVAFKQKLKHMGKSTKKKFSKMAKKFSRRNPGHRNQFIHNSDSTFNLLENNDEETEYVEQGLDGIQEEFADEYDEDDLTNEEIDKHEQISKTASRHIKKLSTGGRQLPQPHGETGRQLPCPPGNIEPIVFYGDDNEFAYKNE